MSSSAAQPEEEARTFPHDRCEKDTSRQAGTQAGREGQASKEGREERLSKEKMLCDVRNRIGGQGGPPR